jgi:hypothetical protein
MAFGDRFNAFMDGLGDRGREVLDRAQDGFEEVTERVGERLDGAGDRLEAAGQNLVVGRQERLAARAETIEGGGRLADVRDRIGAAADAVGDALDPLRDVARAGINTLGDVVEAVSAGTVSFESVEGEGFSAEVRLAGREVGFALDLDGTDGDFGAGASAATRLAAFDVETTRSVDDEAGTVRREVSVGGEFLGAEGSAGVGVTSGRTAAGQRGVDLSAFAEALVDDELITREAGVTVNRDASAGQTGIDLGVFGQTAVDGEVTDRTELVATANRDVSASQAGRDRGVARELFDDGAEVARDEAVGTVNVGFSDGQLEFDAGAARESLRDGVEAERSERGVFFDVGGDDQLVERQSGFFREQEVGGQEAERSELVTREGRFGVDDGRLVQGDGAIDLPSIGREVFEDGEEVFTSRVGAEFTRGFNEDGHADFGIDFVREVEVDGVTVVDDREQAFGISTDLTDAENIDNIALAAGIEGLPSEQIAAFFDGDLKGALSGVSELEIERSGEGTDAEIAKRIAAGAADFLAGDDAARASTRAVFDIDAARALVDDLGDDDDEDGFGSGALPAPPVAPVVPAVLDAPVAAAEALLIDEAPTATSGDIATSGDLPADPEPLPGGTVGEDAADLSDDSNAD